MADYSTEDIEMALEESGELLLRMESDGYPTDPELHLHDTTFDHGRGEIIIECADGQVQFPASAIEAVARHEQSIHELGFE